MDRYGKEVLQVSTQKNDKKVQYLYHTAFGMHNTQMLVEIYNTTICLLWKNITTKCTEKKKTKLVSTFLKLIQMLISWMFAQKMLPDSLQSLNVFKLDFDLTVFQSYFDIHPTSFLKM